LPENLLETHLQLLA